MVKSANQVAILWRVGLDSKTPGLLGAHLPRRVVALAVWSLLRKVRGSEEDKGGQECGTTWALTAFALAVFGDLNLSYRACLPAGGSKCCGP